MAPLTLSRLDPDTAVQLLAGVERFDPRGIADAASLSVMCHAGQCFAITAPGGAQAVYVLKVRNGQAWIDACQGEGATDWTATLLPAIELQASELDSVAFQTARPGLVRKARRQGYHVAGWIMKKDVRP